MQVYIHFQDLVSAYVGPFATFAQINEHLAFCRARGDGATVMEIVETVPAGEFQMTPEQDVSFKD